MSLHYLSRKFIEIFSSRYLFYAGCFLIVVGMPLSYFLMSVGILTLGASFLVGLLNHEIQYDRSQKILAFLFSGFYIFYFVGALYSEDLSYSINELRKKLPFLAFPIIFAFQRKFTKKEIEFFLKIFLLSNILALGICFGTYLKHAEDLNFDIRNASVFVSHIRFSLMLGFSLCILYYLTNRASIQSKLFSLLIAIVIISIMVKLEMMTGLIILSLFIFLYSLIYMYNKDLIIYRAVFYFIVFFVLISGFKLYYSAVDYLKVSYPTSDLMLTTTSSGEQYFHLPEKSDEENGNFVWINIADKELNRNWNKISKIDYDSLDQRGQRVKFTLFRYMASKNLIKDSIGIHSLTLEDVQAIEAGCTNYRFSGTSGVYERVNQIGYEIKQYISGSDPNGHSITMRLEFWKAALHIIRDNFWFGVGTGDVDSAFKQAYIDIRSPLTEKWRLRAHNQYLNTLCALGIFGVFYLLMIYLIPIFYPNHSFGFLIGFLVFSILMSFLTEDTLETQAGVFYSTFFINLLYFGAKDQ